MSEYTIVLHNIKRCLCRAKVSESINYHHVTPNYMRFEDNLDRRFTLRLPEGLAKEIDLFVEERGMTATEFVRRALREKLDREKGIVPRDMISRAEFEEVIKRLDEEIESLKTFIEAISVGE